MIDPVRYMANIAAIAYIDGKISPTELGLLNAIREEMGFKKSDFNAAVKLVEKGGHNLTSIGTFADNVKNFEHILRVAHADDDLAPEERNAVNNFASEHGITLGQIAMITADALEAISSAGKLCPSCGAAADRTADFCPKCGASLKNPVEVTAVDFSIPVSGFAIIFADKGDVDCKNAVDYFRSLPRYQSCVREKRTWHLAEFSRSDLNGAADCAILLSKVRSKRVFVDGVEVKWETVFGFVPCLAKRDKAYDPVEYCFGKCDNRLNPWGCRMARMEWAIWAQWFRYGKWENSLGNPVWRFDKERIEHELRTNLKDVQYCPCFSPKFAETVLRCFPEAVRPRVNGDWEFQISLEDELGSIKIVSRSEGIFSSAVEFWATGVRPRGGRAFAELMNKAIMRVEGHWQVLKLLPKETD